MTEAGPPTVQSDATLPALLAGRLHAAATRALALLLSAGLVVTTCAIRWRPGAWRILVCAGATAVAAGGWGLAERRLQHLTERRAEAFLTPPFDGSNGPSRALIGAIRQARSGFAVIGGIAAISLLFVILFSVLGTWIS